MMKAKLNALADRCEREEPSRELDIAILTWALGYRDVFGNGSLFDRGNDGYWTIEGDENNRALPDPTYSLDAHVRPEGDDVFWRSGHDGSGPDPSMFKAEVLICREDLTGSYFGFARTEAMARRAAELRARAALVTP